MLSDYLLIVTPLLPLILALLIPILRSGFTLVIAPLVAFMAAFLIPENSSVHLPWLLTGVHWQLDHISKLFLVFSALVWLVVSVYVGFGKDRLTRKTVYRCLFMLAMSGNMLLIVAADMISFYLGFALMGLSAYGLILKPSQQARRAARVYLTFTLVGELALFVAMLILFNSSGSLLFIDIQQQIPDLAVAFLLLGFGIKLALPGLHPWLPLAYSAGPLISVAVLSGPMMKAGLLGWIRFLPPGADNLQTWGGVLIWIGVSGVLLGSALALMQQRASTILAYSSIAKMGLMSSLFGYALAHPEQSDIVISALVVFAMHHLMIKSALFIGVHDYQQRAAHGWIFAGLILLSISLVGLPFSGGSGVKSLLDIATDGELSLLFMLSAFATALMMLHFLLVVKKQTIKKSDMTESSSSFLSPALAWWVLLPLAWFAPLTPTDIPFEGKSLVITALAIALYLYIRQSWRRPITRAPFFQAGDIYHLLKQLRLLNPVRLKHRNELISRSDWPQQIVTSKVSDTQSLSVPGLLWYSVFALLMLSLLIPS